MRYRFGRFVLDADARQLLSNGSDVHLSPKAYELLLILLGNRARAVSKTELLERLWPSTFVEETNLASLIAEIRRALRDDATNPAFVRTIHGFGYRFAGEATEQAGTTPPISRRTRPCLVLENRILPLLEGVNVIGREPDAAIPCDFPGVSRHHAQILVSKDGATLEDLGSKNGTYVKGERVTSARLSDGDEIRLGSVTLRFQIAPPLAETETVTT